jgi:hypothetical protein
LASLATRYLIDTNINPSPSDHQVILGSVCGIDLTSGYGNWFLQVNIANISHDVLKGDLVAGAGIHNADLAHRNRFNELRLLFLRPPQSSDNWASWKKGKKDNGFPKR